MANNIIREGVKFGSTLKERPQTMTVTSVSDTEVQFTRKGYSRHLYDANRKVL